MWPSPYHRSAQLVSRNLSRFQYHWTAIEIACSAGVLLGRANVISQQSFIRPAMFDLELEWTVGVGGGERTKRRLPEEAVEKQNTP